MYVTGHDASYELPEGVFIITIVVHSESSRALHQIEAGQDVMILLLLVKDPEQCPDLALMSDHLYSNSEHSKCTLPCMRCLLSYAKLLDSNKRLQRQLNAHQSVQSKEGCQAVMPNP